MDIYLFELDSVKKSHLEIQRGQKALYEEIVKNGNRVILSFNQLTDSRAFLSLLNTKDNDSRELSQFEYLEQLIAMRSIQVNSFKAGDIRVNTASQYVQAGLDRCISDNSLNFIYSALPIDFRLDEEITSPYNQKVREKAVTLRDALKYSDLSLLDEKIVEYGEKSALAEDYRFLRQFARLVLKISLAYRPRKSKDEASEKENFTFFMDKVKGILNRENYGISNELVYCTKKLLERVESNIINPSDKQKRSAWLMFIEAEEPYNLSEKEQPIANDNGEENSLFEEARSMAKSIVNLVYNYTIEASIPTVLRHYNKGDYGKAGSFEKDFFVRLTEELNLEKNIRDTNSADIEADDESAVVQLDWQRAVRLVSRPPENAFADESYGQNFKESYEDCFDEHLKHWNSYFRKDFFVSIIMFFIYVAMFVGLDFILGSAQDYFTNEFGKGSLGHVIAINTAGILMFGLLNSLISELTALPDIFESIKNISLDIRDRIAMRKIERVAYRRK